MKLLFLVAEDRYFCSHRLALAAAARRAGAEIYVMTRINSYREVIEREGFHIISWHIRRGSLNPLRAVADFCEVLRAYRSVQPDITHHVGLKPVLYGGLAAQLTGVSAWVNAITGLGHIFLMDTAGIRFLRKLMTVLVRAACRSCHCRVIFQNRDDLRRLVAAGIVSRQRAVLIRSAGVDTERFHPLPESHGVPVVMLASRLIWTKGVEDFVAAARLLRDRGLAARFVLVGSSDPENHASISDAQLQKWVESGAVEYWGHQVDMPSVLAQSSIVCLPSYGEGFPRVLIEAAACARAVISTDVPGCREAVHHLNTGLLVPPRDPLLLADAIELLCRNQSLRRHMGERGRLMATWEFSEDLVTQQTIALYGQLLGPRWPSAIKEPSGGVTAPPAGASATPWPG